MSRPWYGWCDPADRPELPPSAERLLHDELGLGDARQPPVTLKDVNLPEPALPAAVRQSFVEVLGNASVRDDHEARVRHAAGSSYVDLVRLRAGAPGDAPDAVLLPSTHEQVRAVLERCSGERVAVVPFGGGTSVVGGVTPLREGFAGVVSLDVRRMNRLAGVDPTSLVARLEPGLTGAGAEAALVRHGLTLGHFPQSFEHATVGGFVATRSAGQASTGYGRIDDLVEALRVAAPAGDLTVGRPPASAAGPDLRALLVGSEGALGVITEVTLRVRRTLAARRYEGWSLPSFAAGCEALRALTQAGLAPDVARLSDEPETRLGLAQVGGAKGAVARGYLRGRGHGTGCLVVAGWEGAAPVVGWRRRHAARALRRHGGVALGRGAGEAWRRGRFSGPCLRDELLDRGALVETLETAATWSRLKGTYTSVRDAVVESFAGQAVPVLVLCHVSHLYITGASLYFTVLARPKPGAEVAMWQAAKQAASEAIVAQSATITHHHAVGTDHLPWMGAELGGIGVGVLGALKAHLDPAGVCNPGKLVPPDAGTRPT